MICLRSIAISSPVHSSRADKHCHSVGRQFRIASRMGKRYVTWSTPSFRVSIVAILLGFVALAGCGEPDPSFSQQAIDEPVETIDPSTPLDVIVFAEEVPSPPWPDLLIFGSYLIVTGTVVEILPPEWTTPDGRRPESPSSRTLHQASIVTPIVIAVDNPPIVDRVPAELRHGVYDHQIILARPGGSVGPDTISVSYSKWHFTVGENVLLILADTAGGLAPDGLISTSAGYAWGLNEKYTLTEDGQAVAFKGHPLGEIAVDAGELIAALKQAVHDEALPQPTN